ncbi:epithelial membrane protein 2 isoform X1 [Ahaetulla prasina]|uniref:epithelial membrane protein 2 isoform X1 n=1 Tax=Ahaetulla prasina TaxID=499056 RepID=UPI002647D31C|nr:epithelial membrane protein 2 isoform X1 [Ahaetulla prasina]
MRFLYQPKVGNGSLCNSALGPSEVPRSSHTARRRPGAAARPTRRRLNIWRAVRPTALSALSLPGRGSRGCGTPKGKQSQRAPGKSAASSAALARRACWRLPQPRCLFPSPFPTQPGSCHGRPSRRQTEQPLLARSSPAAAAAPFPGQQPPAREASNLCLLCRIQWRHKGPNGQRKGFTLEAPQHRKRNPFFPLSRDPDRANPWHITHAPWKPCRAANPGPA